MTAPTYTGRYAAATGLLGPLAQQLPDLTAALDEDFVADHIGQTLLSRGRISQVNPGSLWYRDDGSCSLRYRVQTSAGSAEGSHTVLARVCASHQAAADYVEVEVLPVAPRSSPPMPWRQWAGSCASSGLAVHPFPIDPAAPTLAQAMDIRALQPGSWPDPRTVPTSVELVHHTRTGAAVLRYGVAGTDVGPATPTEATVYGKVYPDTAGETVHRFLRSRVGSRDGSDGARVPLPTSLGYAPDLRLLLTTELAGQPLLPRWVRSAVQHEPESVPAGPDQVLRQAVRASGRALAALHAEARSSAPLQTVSQLKLDLNRQLTVVARVWPEIAAQVRSRLGQVYRADEGAAPVLCHGDYTPSQVLFAGQQLSGLVDLDTVCWADPAMDLGRFVAHLDLLVTKQGGYSAEPLRMMLTGDFLDGYSTEAGGVWLDGQMLRRAGVFRSIGLAFSALHACRQLKERRLTLALSLLRTADDWTRRINR